MYRVIIRENKFSLLRKAHNLIIDENKKQRRQRRWTQQITTVMIRWRIRGEEDEKDCSSSIGNLFLSNLI